MYYEDGWVLGNHKTAAKLVGDEWKPVSNTYLKTHEDAMPFRVSALSIS